MKKLHRWFVSGALAALVLSFAPGCGSDDDKNPASPGGGGTPADVTIDIVADMGSGAFGASPTTVTVGQTVSWRNTRGTTHTATANGGAWNTGNIAPGATSTPITMNTQGPFAYSCNIHPTMTSTLNVNP